MAAVVVVEALPVWPWGRSIAGQAQRIELLPASSYLDSEEDSNTLLEDMVGGRSSARVDMSKAGKAERGSRSQVFEVVGCLLRPGWAATDALNAEIVKFQIDMVAKRIAGELVGGMAADEKPVD